MTLYNVATPDGVRIIDASRMEVVNGHLIGRRYHGPDSDAVAAWAPGQWQRFDERPSDGSIERQRLTLDVFEIAARVDVMPPELRAHIDETITLLRACISDAERDAA